jgi:hypothetical protein
MSTPSWSTARSSSAAESLLPSDITESGEVLDVSEPGVKHQPHLGATGRRSREATLHRASG